MCDINIISNEWLHDRDVVVVSKNMTSIKDWKKKCVFNNKCERKKYDIL